MQSSNSAEVYFVLRSLGVEKYVSLSSEGQYNWFNPYFEIAGLEQKYEKNMNKYD